MWWDSDINYLVTFFTSIQRETINIVYLFWWLWWRGHSNGVTSVCYNNTYFSFLIMSILFIYGFGRFVKLSKGISGTTVSASSFSYYTTISRRDIITRIKNINIRRLAFSSTTANTISKRSFRILGVQQLAIGGLDKAALTSFWVPTILYS